jgi:hypothetical protein
MGDRSSDELLDGACFHFRGREWHRLSPAKEDSSTSKSKKVFLTMSAMTQRFTEKNTGKRSSRRLAT